MTTYERKGKEWKMERIGIVKNLLAENGIAKLPRAIYFDMDGTLADLYQVPNWLRELRAESCVPYEAAAPMWELSELDELLQILQWHGVRIGIISWTSKMGSPQYNKEVRKAKVEWLEKYFTIKFDEIHIVKYGTRKDYVALCKDGLLIDDDEWVRFDWRGNALSPDFIKILLEEEEE